MTGTGAADILLDCGQGRTPGQSVVRWTSAALDTTITAVESLHPGSGPWLLRMDRPPGAVLLRCAVPGRIGTGMIRTGAAALQTAARHGLPAPRLIAADLTGEAAGELVTLETFLPGSSALPPRVSVERLREAGAAVARVHAVPLLPGPDLPLRTRPTQADDRAMERRWATLYNATANPAAVTRRRDAFVRAALDALP